METDYPAAHSMDTTWFAVDRDGCVAIFSSWESGAVPANAARLNFDSEEAIENLTAAIAKIASADSRVVFDPALVDTRTGEKHHVSWGSFPYDDVLMFLDDSEPIKQELLNGNAVIYLALNGVSARWSSLSETTYNQLHQSGLCKGCGHYSEPDSEGETVFRRSFFQFEHSNEYENWISGPYARLSVPTSPVSFDQLPHSAKCQIEGVAFPELSFSETVRLQPVGHVECETWEYGYVTEDGTTVRAVPGSEREFVAEVLEEYQKADLGLKIEVPDVEETGT